MNLSNMTRLNDVDSFCKNYIFVDGLMKGINFDFKEKFCCVKIECRNLCEEWLMLTLYMENVDFIRFVDVRGNMEIISSPLHIYNEKNSNKLLITFDDECLTMQRQNFIIRAEKIFFSALYDY